MKFPVQHGARYAIGIDLPFFLSNATVARWASEHGFTNVSVRDRPSLLPYDPTRAPGYSDNWDTLVEATYAGNATSIDAPGAPAWALTLSAPARVGNTVAIAGRTPKKKAEQTPQVAPLAAFSVTPLSGSAPNRSSHVIPLAVYGGLFALLWGQS